MKAILNTIDLFTYQSTIHYYSIMNWLNTYKYVILCGISIIGIVLAAGATFGWDELLELENSFHVNLK